MAAGWRPALGLFANVLRLSGHDAHFLPLSHQPLQPKSTKEALAEVVDFSRLTKCNKAPRLFLSATNVRTGKIKVFENDAVSVDVVLASACLPYLFHAVEIDGE